MTIIYSLSALTALLFLILYITDCNWRPLVTNYFTSLLFIGIVIRLIAMKLNLGYESDINCFKFWSSRLVEKDFGSFYSKDTFTDYPPGYMYVLYLIGKLRGALGLSYESGAFTFLIKLPAMICDILTGLLLYKVAYKKMKPAFAWLVAFAYLINPAVIINSAVWGQVDAVYTLVILVSVYHIAKKSYLPSFILFAIAILIKPQAFIFTPVYIFASYEFLYRNKFSKSSVIQFLTYCATSVLLLLLGILPFSRGLDFNPVIHQYKETISSYPYATLNAYNFYAFTGGMWNALSVKLIGIPYFVWGAIFLNIIVMLSVYLLNRNHVKSNYFLIAGFINALTFMFSIKMHERYLFPSLVFFLIAYVYKPEKKFLLLYGGFSLTLFVNCADVLNMYHNGNSLQYLQDSYPLLSMLNLALTGFLVYTAFSSYEANRAHLHPEEELIVNNPRPCDNPSFQIESIQPLPKMEKKDYALVAALMLVYGVIAFTHLGNTASPQTVWDSRNKSEPIVTLATEEHLTKLQFMLGVNEKQAFDLFSSSDGDDWVFQQKITGESVFAWKEVELNFSASYIKIVPATNGLILQEMAFFSNGRLLPILHATEDSLTLFDEQELVPEKPSFKNSTYFDEIFHARTAYEFIHRLPVYENTHPPLGKVIISLGILMFGMTPFGWRFMGTAFGVGMIFLIYIFAKKIFKSTGLSFFAAFLMAFDFMHFSQTRIATIDTYVTFFIIGMYYFMFLYYKKSFYNTKLSQTLFPLAGSGICMGLAIASKWSGVYAVAGLALLFFYTLYKRYQEYLFAKKTNNPAITAVFIPNTVKTLCWCVLFFVVVPLVIYGLAYIPFLRSSEAFHLKTIFNNQKHMLSYHANLVVPKKHPYASPWWQWPFDIRPIFYYTSTVSKNVKTGISSFGNPVIWWCGLVSFFYCIHSLSKKSDKTALFLIIAYLSQYLPWCLIARETYVYHYFPSVPFLILMITYCARYYFVNEKTKYIYVFTGMVMVLFAMFYPILSGMPVHVGYVKYFLEWLPTWQLI